MSTSFLKKYGVSPITGFLPEEPPLQRLPEQFAVWEDIVDDLPALILAEQVRRRIDAMPVLSVGKLSSVREQRRAYSVLGFLTHAYIWSPPQPVEHVPRNLAEPLLDLAEKLGIPPLATFAGLCLWNFRLLSDAGPSQWDLTNLATIQTFTGANDEMWFYLVSVALEQLGGPCIANGVSALYACKSGDTEQVIVKLQKMKEDIERITKLLMRLPEKLDPQYFYNRLRPYLAGSEGMEAAGLPNGVRYGDEQEYRKYSGGSNGQSSLIQTIDIILNVDHHALGHRQPPRPLSEPVNESPKPKSPFLKKMREYMPREHRDFLNELERRAILRAFVSESSNVALKEAYDACLIALREFRSKHIQIVMRYVSLPSRTNRGGQGETGTGGTQLMPFLKQTRDEVSDVAIGDWKKSLMSSKNY